MQRLILIGFGAIVLLTVGALVLVHRWTEYEGSGKGLGPGASRAFNGPPPGDLAPPANPILPMDRAPMAPPPPDPTAAQLPAQAAPQAEAQPEAAPEPEPERGPRQRRPRRATGAPAPGE